MAIVTKLWLDHTANPFNATMVKFMRKYLLGFFDRITKYIELSKMTSRQFQPKRPKLSDRRTKRLKVVPDANQNSLILMPTSAPPPEPKEVSTAFSIPHWQMLLNEQQPQLDDDENDEDEEVSFLEPFILMGLSFQVTILVRIYITNAVTLQCCMTKLGLSLLYCWQQVIFRALFILVFISF